VIHGIVEMLCMRVYAAMPCRAWKCSTIQSSGRDARQPVPSGSAQTRVPTIPATREDISIECTDIRPCGFVDRTQRPEKAGCDPVGIVVIGSRAISSIAWRIYSSLNKLVVSGDWGCWCFPGAQAAMVRTDARGVISRPASVGPRIEWPVARHAPPIGM